MKQMKFTKTLFLFGVIFSLIISNFSTVLAAETDISSVANTEVDTDEANNDEIDTDDEDSKNDEADPSDESTDTTNTTGVENVEIAEDETNAEESTEEDVIDVTEEDIDDIKDTEDVEESETETEVDIEKIEESEVEVEAEEAEVETDVEEIEEEEVDEECIAPGVWSDQDPYFTDEVPAIPESSNSRRRVAARAIYLTNQEAHDAITALQSEFPEGLKWTNFEPYGSKTTSTVESDKIGYIFQGGAVKGARYFVGCAAIGAIVSDRLYPGMPMRVVDAGNFTYEDLHVGDFLRVNSSHFVTIWQITDNALILVEGNYNSSVHWGRVMTRDEAMRAINFVVTRYPEGYRDPEDPEKVTTVASGTEGSLNWTISSDHVLKITGTGTMPNYDYQDRPSWETSGEPFYSVEISSGVENIGNYAFYYPANEDGKTSNSGLINVILPDTLTSIGNGAFRGSNITGITIPSSITTVSDDAFRQCFSLASVSISEGVQVIGERAFHSCTSLGYVDFPSSLTKLGGGAFSGCEKLTQVRFMPSKSTLTIGEGVFVSNWNLHLISLPEGITTLPKSLFQSCKTIQYLYIPKTITELGKTGEEIFMSSYVGTIYYGGTQDQWDSVLKSTYYQTAVTNSSSNYAILSNATVVCEQDDPFVPAADDPGDLITDPCKDGHVGEKDEDGNCTICGEPMEESGEESPSPSPSPSQTPGDSPSPTPSTTPSVSPSPSPSPTPSSVPTATPAQSDGGNSGNSVNNNNGDTSSKTESNSTDTTTTDDSSHMLTTDATANAVDMTSLWPNITDFTAPTERPTSGISLPTLIPEKAKTDTTLWPSTNDVSAQADAATESESESESGETVEAQHTPSPTPTPTLQPATETQDKTESTQSDSKWEYFILIALLIVIIVGCIIYWLLSDPAHRTQFYLWLHRHKRS